MRRTRAAAHEVGDRDHGVAQRSTAALSGGRRGLRHTDPSQLLFQLQEIFEDRTYIRHGVEVRAGDVVLDVGANVGVAAAFFASICGAGVVHSFEPVEPIYHQLCDNVRPYPSCFAHNYGLAPEAGTLPITYYPGSAAMSGLYADPAHDREVVRTCLINSGVAEEQADDSLVGKFEPVALTCEVRPLSAVMDELGLDTVDLLKIDVEKAELDVLQGIDERSWQRIRQIVVEIHDQDGRLATVSEMLEERGFAPTIAQDDVMRGTNISMLFATRA